MQKVNIKQLRYNNELLSIYSNDKDFSDFKDTIEKFGVLEPLIVREVDELYEVVSGNRRLRASIELGFEVVPVIVKDYLEKPKPSELIVHQKQRIKTPSQIRAELNILKAEYGYSQGKRGGSEKYEEGKKQMEQLKKDIGKSTLDRIRQIESTAMELYNNDLGLVNSVFKKLDENGSVSGTLNSLKNKLKDKQNSAKLRNKGVILPSEGEHYTLYNKSSKSLKELNDESIQTVFTSPPYYKMRDYLIGSNQLGHEKTLEEFTDNLVAHFTETYRVLKPKGSLFVNLSDKIENGQFVPLTFMFAQKMKEKGWLWVDQITWIKNNPQFTNGKRSVGVHEYILHFAKSPHYYYDLDWLKGSTKIPEQMIYGLGGTNTKLKSAFDFRHPVIRTNSVNNYDLKVACERYGIHLTHSATFPVELPMMGILCTSKPGDTILDVYNGTATTGQAALVTGRKYVGYELNDTYLEMSKIRIKEFTATNVVNFSREFINYSIAS